MEEKDFNIGEYLKSIEEDRLLMEGDYNKQLNNSLFYSNVIVNYEEEGVLC